MKQEDIVSYKAGEQIFAQGEIGDSAYLIQSGLVRISVGKADDQRVIGLLGEGQLIGEMAAIDSRTRVADAFALEDTVLTRIEAHQLVDRLERTEPLVRNVLMLMIDRYRSGLKNVLDPAPLTVQTVSADLDLFALRVEAALKADLAAERVAVGYQPVVDLITGRPLGYEALLRWESESFPDLATQALVDIAEQTRLINTLGAYVFRRACSEFVANRLHEAHWLSINVSAKQLLQPGFAQSCIDIAKEIGMPFKRILFELTESCIPEPDLILPAIKTLREHGARIALDDFGTGTSSLIHVSKFNVDCVKLDREIVQEIETSPEAFTIVRAVIGAAAALEIDVIAEGVQTQAQREKLSGVGCKFAQGYLFAKAEPAEKCAASLVA